MGKGCATPGLVVTEQLWEQELRAKKSWCLLWFAWGLTAAVCIAGVLEGAR